MATKAQAEAALAQLDATRLEITILRPGAICSLHNSHWGDELVDRLRADGWPATRHPDDIIPWVHTADLAEMTWLCVTEPAAAGETFIAVDENVALRDFWVPICQALGQVVTPPAREAVRSRCRIGKIRDVLGYTLAHDVRVTVDQLVQLARAISE